MDDSFQKKIKELNDVVRMELGEVGVVVNDVRRKTDDVIGMQFVDRTRFDVQSKRIEQAKMKGETLCANRKETQDAHHQTMKRS